MADLGDFFSVAIMGQKFYAMRRVDGPQQS